MVVHLIVLTERQEIRQLTEIGTRPSRKGCFNWKYNEWSRDPIVMSDYSGYTTGSNDPIVNCVTLVRLIELHRSELSYIYRHWVSLLHQGEVNSVTAASEIDRLTTQVLRQLMTLYSELLLGLDFV